MVKVLYVGGPLHGESSEMADPPETYEVELLGTEDKVLYTRKHRIEGGVGDRPMQLELAVFVAATVQNSEFPELLREAMELSDK